MRIALILFLIFIAGCGGKLANYDIGVSAGHTEYDNSTISPPSTSIGARVNFHFDVKER